MTIDSAANGINTMDAKHSIIEIKQSFLILFPSGIKLGFDLARKLCTQQYSIIIAAGIRNNPTSLNAVIVSENKVLNEGGLRYADEFVRHKALDAIGDLYTCGSFLLGSYRGVRSGHFMTNQLLRAVFEDKTAWRHQCRLKRRY